MRYYGCFRSANATRAQTLTGETFLSLGGSAVSGRSVCLKSRGISFFHAVPLVGIGCRDGAAFSSSIVYHGR